ncbi:MAG: hypothetical protein GY842_09425 [bacterium]|nr:hypothetical protein [bacterium]
MSAHSQPHRLLRTLLLIVSTLAVVGVVFAIYVQYARDPAPLRKGEDPGSARRQISAPEPTTQAAGETAGLELGGVPMPTGARTRLNLYGTEGVQARLEVEVDRFEPVGESGRELRLERPLIRFRTPAGQRVNVSADRGLVEMSQQRGDAYDLARGRLEGHVVILMDRLDDAQRAELPPEERDELTDARKIRVELEDLIFDLEYSRVETSGAISVWLAEVRFEGRQMLLRYDETGSRIEYLTIGEGKRIALRGLGDAFAVALPGAGGSGATESKAIGGVPVEPVEVAEIIEPAEPPPPLEDDGVPVLMAEAPRRHRPREIVTYTARFERDVVVDQFSGQLQTGLLSADRLEFLFDFGQTHRELARKAPGESPTAESEAYDEESWAVLSWKGPLTVDLLRDQPPVPKDVFGRRLHLTATGEVRVVGREGGARCAKLEYQRETELVRLHGKPKVPFVLEIGENGELTGRELTFDTEQQVASVVGPGVLSDRRSREVTRGATWDAKTPTKEVSVRFAKEMNLCLGTQVREKIDPLTGETIVRRQEYVRSAELLGDVAMSQEGDLIAADRVELDFRPPAEAGALTDSIEHLRAEGRVRMIQGEERISCREIDVDLGHDANGKLVPTRAEAVGDVVASQRSRVIRASDRMTVVLDTVEVEKPPFDMVQAKVEAVRRGVSVDQVDWQAKRAEYERRKQLVLGIRSLQATGAVTARDPEQNLNIDAGALDCTFVDGRQIDQGKVQGREGLPANVEFGDFGIMGREIQFDARAQWAEVPGAGRLSFTSRKDLDGRATDQPVPIAVTWVDSMSFRGRENTAVFAGGVHAVSRNSTFDCREMVLDFEDQEESKVRAPVPDPWDGWLVQPFRSGPKAGSQLRLEAPPIKKQLAYLSAEGGVVALTTTNDESTGRVRTRARLAGPRLAVDLRPKTQAMTIDEAGTLLIEDYRLSDAGESGAVTKMSPFGAEGANLPSQTFLSWKGAMSYYSGPRLAVFEKDVELVYRSGSKMLLAEGVIGEAGQDGLGASDGRDARVFCQQLNVGFLRQSEGDLANSRAGVGPMSGNRVSSFTASGGVFFEDSGVSVNCRTVTFDRERNLLQILGTRSQPAELIDQRRGRYRSIVGPTIYWERDTDRIEAPRSTIRVH